MSGLQIPERQGLMPASDVSVFQSRLEDGYQRWLTIADLQGAAADWYATGQDLCRQRVNIDDVLQMVPAWKPRALANTADLNNFRHFVRHYLTRGYEDALR